MSLITRFHVRAVTVLQRLLADSWSGPISLLTPIRDTLTSVYTIGAEDVFSTKGPELLASTGGVNDTKLLTVPQP